MLKLTGENIVIVTVQNLNVLSIGEKWFIQNHFLAAEDILDGKTVVTPNLSLIHTEDFRIQILSNQFAIFIEKLENNQKISEKVIDLAKKIISSNLLTPIVAIGVNFHFFSSAVQSLEDITKKINFNPDNNKLHNFLKDGKNMRFGSYTSLDFIDSRLRIDIKPVQGEENETEILSAAFNYSKNVKNENLVNDATEFFGNYNEFKKFASDSANIINESI